MKMTLQTLTEFLDDPQYQDLTVDLARANASDRQWWAVMDKLAEEGTKTAIWETTQWVALLFDIYPGAIDRVKVNFYTESDGEDTYLSTSVYINGTHCHEDSVELDNEDSQRCCDIDDMETLHEALANISDMGNGYLLGRVGQLEGVFDVEMTSAQQARDIGAKHAPEHHAFYVRDMLGKLRQDGERQKQASAPRLPKV